MWPRVVEAMLGCWLAMSPFIFRHPEAETALWTNDFVCGAIVIALALASFWRPLHFVHLGIIVVAAWLIAFGYLYQPHPAPPALQNAVLTGWLLLMFAIIPSDTNNPPRGWRELYRKQ